MYSEVCPYKGEDICKYDFFNDRCDCMCKMYKIYEIAQHYFPSVAREQLEHQGREFERFLEHLENKLGRL